MTRPLTGRLRRWRPRHPRLLLAVGGLVVVLALASGSHPAHVGTRPALPAPIQLTAAHLSSSKSTTPAGSGSGSSSGEGPPGIQVGPGNTTAPTTPAAGSGGSVSGGSQPSPGLFDITGHIEAAIDDWFRDVVTSALNPILTLLGHTLLATPNVTAQSRVGQLWQMTEGIADAFLVLFVRHRQLLHRDALAVGSHQHGDRIEPEATLDRKGGDQRVRRVEGRFIWTRSRSGPPRAGGRRP